MNEVVRVAEMFTEPLQGGVYGQLYTMDQCHMLYRCMCMRGYVCVSAMKENTIQHQCKCVT